MISIFKKGLGLLLLFHLFSCQGQITPSRTTLSDDFSESLPFYFGMPEQVSARDTSPAWSHSGTPLILTGTVYQRDGKTPAAGVLLYYYQTNAAGVYLHKPDEKRSMPPNKLGQTHGHIRGWVKTAENGKYEIFTQQPGRYPRFEDIVHIHVYVKERQRKEWYYIDNFVFDDDKLLTTTRRNKMKNRGGSGVLRLVKKDGHLIGERNIILGLNIPGFSAVDDQAIKSGKEIGENVFSFAPEHAWGPDRGHQVCPICKYGWYQGILYFVSGDSDWEAIKKWLTFLEGESRKREKYLKVYLVYSPADEFDAESCRKQLENIGETLDLKKVALTFVPSFTDASASISKNNINPAVENTFLVYQRSIIIDKYINLKPTGQNFARMSKRLDERVNEYFDLPKLSKDEQRE